jgi:phosphatidylglycerophosphate synthase
VQHLPLILTALRLLLAPLVIALAYTHAPRWTFVACLFFAIGSDYWDGVIARKYHVVTPFLRRFDSITDAIFYLAVLWAIWVLHANVVRSHIVGIGIVLALECIRYLFDSIKFRKVASYHMWSAKCWQISIVVAFVSLFGFEISDPFFSIAITLGIVSDIEGLCASVILTKPLTDVPSIFHAWHWRHTTPTDP